MPAASDLVTWRGWPRWTMTHTCRQRTVLILSLMVICLVNGKRKQPFSGLIQVAKVDLPLKDICLL